MGQEDREEVPDRPKFLRRREGGRQTVVGAPQEMGGGGRRTLPGGGGGAGGFGCRSRSVDIGVQRQISDGTQEEVWRKQLPWESGMGWTGRSMIKEA